MSLAAVEEIGEVYDNRLVSSTITFLLVFMTSIRKDSSLAWGFGFQVISYWELRAYAAQASRSYSIIDRAISTGTHMLYIISCKKVLILGLL